jgi:hypothetical protein
MCLFLRAKFIARNNRASLKLRPFIIATAQREVTIKSVGKETKKQK